MLRRRRLDINELFDIIIAEAEVASRKANFALQVEHIRRVTYIIDQRMKNFWWAQYGSEIERALARKADVDKEEGNRERPRRAGSA